MTTIILSVGDELVLGQTVDTNSAWMSQRLASIGCGVLAHVTVADDQAAIETAIREAVGRCDVLLISGGLGPTADDLTRQALAAVMDAPLELNEQWLANMEEFFRQRNRPMPETNKIQAMIPRGASMIWNHNGTAAGICAELPTANGQRSTQVFIMPGVPKEMMLMFDTDVLPWLSQRSNGAVILSRTLHTFGLGESAVAQLLGRLMDRSRNPSVGTTVTGGIVSLRINSRFKAHGEAEARLAETEAACTAALGDLIYGADDQTLPQVVGQLLRSASRSVATAESCTGGLLAKMFTDVPGSSAYFKQGWITYTNESKTQLLGVPADLVAAHGAVSEPVVLAMAAGARQRAASDFALSISGIAGPEGGTPVKPVGTVCIGMDGFDGRPIARTFPLFGDREMIRDRAAKMALTMLRYRLMGKSLPF